jgi:hypothetical protein
MILGLDFSIKSTAATLLSGDNYTFYTFARNSVIKEDINIALKAAGVIVNTVPDEQHLSKKSSIAERERSSLQDASVLIPEITKYFSNLKIDAYGIEGFSFASTGNRLAQISGYQWVLRWELQKIGMSLDKFWIFSPMTIKASAGKGNYKKDEMIEAFINSEDVYLRNTGFWKALSSQPSLFQTKRGAWVKPTDDLVDAYFVLKTVEKYGKEESEQREKVK